MGRRTELLSSLQGKLGNYRLLVQQAWFADHKKNVVDGPDAAKRFEKLAQTARGWGATLLAVECEVARAVMLDEYAGLPTEALEALNDAENVDGPQLALAQAKAKVLYRAGDHEGSLAVMAAISDEFSPDDYVDRAFAYRAAGISAAELSRFTDARTYFHDARQAANEGGGDLKAMAIGLLGDLAVIELRLSDHSSMVSHLQTALAELDQMGAPTTDHQRYALKMIGHVITWITRELFPQRVKKDFGPLAFGKCSEPDPAPSVVEPRGLSY